jgi:hypothetical protein
MNKGNYLDMMKMLGEAHRWKLGDRTLDAFYGQIGGISEAEFEQAFSKALVAGGPLSPSDFARNLKDVIMLRSRPDKPVLQYDLAKYPPYPEGLAKIRKLLIAIQADKRHRQKPASDRWERIWQAPLTDDEVLKSSGTSLSTLLAEFAGEVNSLEMNSEESKKLIWVDEDAA